MNKFQCKTPCKDCPYRLDAPLQKWDRSHFASLLGSDTDKWGKVFDCHKANGSVCVGWLMMQAKNNMPSMHLRMMLAKEYTDGNLKEGHVDSLYIKKGGMYASAKEMIAANYPLLLINEWMDSSEGSVPHISEKFDACKALGIEYAQQCPKCEDSKEGLYRANGRLYPIYINATMDRDSEGHYGAWEEIHYCPTCNLTYLSENSNY